MLCTARNEGLLVLNDVNQVLCLYRSLQDSFDHFGIDMPALSAVAFFDFMHFANALIVRRLYLARGVRLLVILNRRVSNFLEGRAGQAEDFGGFVGH